MILRAACKIRPVLEISKIPRLLFPDWSITLTLQTTQVAVEPRLR